MELRAILPAIVPAPPPEPFAVQVIIVDWLYREVDCLAEIKMPVLQHIAGHRNADETDKWGKVIRVAHIKLE